MSEGYWYTFADGRREWRERPRCDCGGEIDHRQLQHIDDAPEDGTLVEMVCLSCNKLVGSIQKPNTAAIRRGQELAERYGW